MPEQRSRHPKAGGHTVAARTKRTYRDGFREGERTAAKIICAFLRTLAKPGTQPADYYERAAERIEETYGT